MSKDYEEPIRVRVHDSDWQLLKIKAIRQGGLRYQELAGDLLAELAGSGEWRLRANEQTPDWRSVWIQVPSSARPALDKLRAERSDASWARLMNAALTLAGEGS